MDVVCGAEGFGTGRAALLLPGLTGRVGELGLQLKDLVLELLDVVDCVRQGGLLAHLKTPVATCQRLATEFSPMRKQFSSADKFSCVCVFIYTRQIFYEKHRTDQSVAKFRWLDQCT